MKIGLIGPGKWGQNYLKILKDLPGIETEIGTRQNWMDLKPDGVIISTPPDSHIEIAEHFLKQDIPLLIEKPLALSYQEADRLSQYSAPILVNHIHLFSAAYQRLKSKLPDNIDSIYSCGVGGSSGFGPIRSYSPLWDYGPHDVALILDLLQSAPISVQAIPLPKDLRCNYRINLDFGKITTQSLIGNDSPAKIRTLEVNFQGLSLVYDDGHRPKEDPPPLLEAVKVFFLLIRGLLDYRQGLDLSLKVLKILEACQKSADSNSETIFL